MFLAETCILLNLNVPKKDSIKNLWLADVQLPSKTN